MIEKRPIFYNFPAYLKILTFALFVLTSLIIVLLLGILIALPFYGGSISDLTEIQGDYSDPAIVSMMKYLQIISQVGLFLIPPIVFAFLINRDVWGYLHLKKTPYTVALIIGALALIASAPFVGWLAEINNLLDLPDWMSGVEAWMQESETETREMMESFLSTTSTSGFIVNLIMIAIIPGIGEELFFRGVVLRLFREWTKNIHLAVIISSILFSAFHLQFYGFLPRLFLGMFLGYLFVWSGNLWIPVIVHFINNAFAVVYMYNANLLEQPVSLESVAVSDNPVMIIGSILIFAMLMAVFWKYQKKKTIGFK